MKEQIWEYTDPFAEIEIAALARLFHLLYTQLKNVRNYEGHTHGSISQANGFHRIDILFGTIREQAEGILPVEIPFPHLKFEVPKRKSHSKLPLSYVRFGAAHQFADPDTVSLQMSLMPGMSVVNQCFLDLAGEPWPGDEDAILCPFGFGGSLDLSEIKGAAEIVAKRFGLEEQNS